MTPNKRNRQALKACVARFHMLSCIVKNDSRNVFRLYLYVYITHNGKFRQKVYVYLRRLSGRNNHVGIKLGNLPFQFAFKHVLYGSAGPIEGIFRKSDKNIFHQILSSLNILFSQVFSQRRQGSEVEIQWNGFYRISPRSYDNVYLRSFTRPKGQVLYRIANEDAIHNVIHHTVVRIRIPTDFTVISIQ